MSTQPSAARPSSPIPQSSTTSTPNSPLSNTSTLLFGFLVSALSVFAVFMTVAIIWNRLVARRRAIDAMLARNLPPYPLRSHRPRIWDIWAVPDKHPPPWICIKPVAARNCNFSASSQTTPTTRTILSRRDRILNYLPPEITYIFRQPIPQTSAPSHIDISLVELSHGSNVQISLLISMPCAPQSKPEHTFHELVIATTNAVYHDPGPS